MTPQMDIAYCNEQCVHQPFRIKWSLKKMSKPKPDNKISVAGFLTTKLYFPYYGKAQVNAQLKEGHLCVFSLF